MNAANGTTTQHQNGAPVGPLPPQSEAQLHASPGIGKIAQALAHAQGEFGAIEKNRRVKVTSKSGASYEFDYATLDEILAKTRPALAKHEIALTQHLLAADGRPRLRTMLLHSSGEWLASEFPLPGGAPDSPQAYGSLLTYMRRYAITALLGVAADEDDDGNAAEGNQAKGTERPTSRKPPPALASQDKVAALRDLMLKEHGWKKERAMKWLRVLFDVEGPADLTVAQADVAEAILVALKSSIEDYRAEIAKWIGRGLVRKEAADVE